MIWVSHLVDFEVSALSTPRSPSFALRWLYEPSWTLSSSPETLGNCVNFREVFQWCLTCLAPAPSSPLPSVISTIWLQGFGGHGCILLGDDGLVRDFEYFSDPREIGQAYRSPNYDCYFPSIFVFLPWQMDLGSFFKLVF
jgi:hypothetical protein